MPKQLSLPSFDAAALHSEVLKQDLGLAVSTNDPAAFKRLMYSFMAKNPSLPKLRILTGKTANTFLLVKPEATPA